MEYPIQDGDKLGTCQPWEVPNVLETMQYAGYKVEFLPVENGDTAIYFIARKIGKEEGRLLNIATDVLG